MNNSMVAHLWAHEQENTMRLVIVFDSDPEPPIVYDVKASEGWLKLDCISGDFEDFSMYKIK